MVAEVSFLEAHNLRNVGTSEGVRQVSHHGFVGFFAFVVADPGAHVVVTEVKDAVADIGELGGYDGGEPAASEQQAHLAGLG